MTGVNSLNLVRDELFATMDDAERSLEHFIVDRQNGTLLQQAIENLQQVRGTLNLIELTGAELLAQEILHVAMDIPTGVGPERDGQLSALGSALHVLRRYLEGLGLHRQEIPELLLPAINKLRQACNQAPLPESFFFSVRLDQERPRSASPAVDAAVRVSQTRHLRHMYQVGLLGLLRDPQPQPGLKLMARAMARLDDLYANDPRGRLCWIGAAMFEAALDGQLRPSKAGKQLGVRIDRELKQLLSNPQYQAPRHLLKEMLYLIVLADSHGPRATQIREVFNLGPLPFTAPMLVEEYRRLAGPGQAVMRSLSSAIREELGSVKDLLDLIERGVAQDDGFANLHALLGKLAKTLGMVGLSSASNALQAQLAEVATWSRTSPGQTEALNHLADAVLYVESMVASLEEVRQSAPVIPLLQPGQTSSSFAVHQLTEAKIVVLDEAKVGLALSKRAITAYLESGGDKMHLANVPVTLQAVRGGLWFLGQERTARLVGCCADYIQQQMLEADLMPVESMLNSLADALTSLEYYLETGGASRNDVLELADRSVEALRLAVAC